MLKAIREFFDRNMAASEAGGHSIELATAALLVEVVRIDRETSPAEREAVLRAVHEKFGLSGAQADELLRLAEEEVRHATDYYQFTSLINRRFTQAQKERVIELMWRVAYADAELSAHELHLMRKIAGLLHVPDDAYIAAKLRAKEQRDRG
ncbi:MAG: TerB family tellurite resistance protein [Pseudomonadota bacterium]